MSQSDFVQRGQALVAAGQYQEAVKVCRLGLLGRPTTVDGRVVLARALLALKRFDEVLAETRIAIEIDPLSAPAYTLKGEALLRKGDPHAASEALQKARALTPNDPQVAQLLFEAEQPSRAPAPSGNHPAVGFVRETHTRGYPSHQSEEEPGDGDHYTRPTSIATPTSRDGKSRVRQAVGQPVGHVGPHTGTVDLDPEVDADDLDDDLGTVSPPPRAGAPRGAALLAPRESGLELDADDIIDVDDDETPPPVEITRPAKGRSAVRSAVGLVSGPLDQVPPPSGPQSSLAQAIAGTPHVMQVTPVAPAPQVAAAAPRAPAMMPVAAPHSSRPPAAAQPMPLGGPPQAVMPTMAIAPAPAAGPAPAWAQRTVVATGPNGLPGPAGGVDPALAALAASVDAQMPGPASAAPRPPAEAPAPAPAPREMKTGMRRTRSRLRVAIWIALGATVIGGGVFAGFQIRAMRLGKQIDTARAHATDLAKQDTWAGWAAARDSLAGIVAASNTPENRAALALARASIAFELGDGLAEAKAAVTALGGEGGADGLLAAAYVALASDDPKAAKSTAEAALAAAPTDAAALYVAGRAQLLGGDASGAIKHLKAAVAADPRALYAVGLAHAYGEANDWDAALAAIDRALAASPDHPAALIERAELDVRSGRVLPNTARGGELRAQLDKLVTEGGQPLANQPRGVSPEQVALAQVALAHVQLARGDAAGALAAVKAALALDLDDQRVVEGIIGAFWALEDVAKTRTAAEKTLEHWPGSRAARIALAEASIALGKPDDALAVIAKSGEVTTLPLGLAARGDAKVAAGDLDGARADYDLALKREPKLEAAMIGRVGLDLGAGRADDARRLIEPRFPTRDSVAALPTAIAYATAMRQSGDPDRRERARLLLEKLTGGPLTPVVVRAKVELARIYRDGGDLRAARDAYGAAASAGSLDARLDSGLLLIEDRDPKAGYDTLTQLLGALGADAPAPVLLEAARASALVGDHAGAAADLARAETARGLVKWQLDRERARLALRRGDVASAAAAITSALEGCGADPETFLLAADVVSTDLAVADDKSPPKLTDLTAKLTAAAADRLAGRAEGALVTAILALARGKADDAMAAYKKASDALDAEKATARRRARANLGFAILAYTARNLPEAKTQLDIVIAQDPASYAAYLYRADVSAEKKDPKAALADAQLAVAYNPDLLDGWVQVATYAHATGDKALVADAIAHVSAIAPDSPHIKELQALK